MSVQASALNLQPSIVTTSAWRSRALTVILMVAIAGIFWVDSRYPALLKRYNAGTHVVPAAFFSFSRLPLFFRRVFFSLFSPAYRAPQARPLSLPLFRLSPGSAFPPRRLCARRCLPHRNPSLRKLVASARFHRALFRQEFLVRLPRRLSVDDSRLPPLPPRHRTSSSPVAHRAR